MLFKGVRGGGLAMRKKLEFGRITGCQKSILPVTVIGGITGRDSHSLGVGSGFDRNPAEERAGCQQK